MLLQPFSAIRATGNGDITRKWTAPIRDWVKVLNYLVICFEGHLQF
jgi:hypothetical protein